MTSVARIRMSRRGDYEDWKQLSTYLARQVVAGSVNFVLGAGASVYFGLPCWEELLKKLYAARLETPPNVSLKVQAEHFRNTFFTDNVTGFIEAVKNVLYETVNVSFERLRQHDTLAAIASLLMSSGLGSGCQVITFNWDDLLEIYLGLHGYHATSVVGERYWSKKTDVVVFHPHGFIPFQDHHHASEDIVFDQFSYSEVVGKETGIWRQILLNAMRTHTCIFIGLSGEDDNLDSLLVQCQAQHASVDEGSLFWAVTFTTTTEPATLMKWERRGVYPVTLSDYSALPALLFEVTEIAVKLRSELI